MVDGRLNFDTKIDTKGFSKGVSSLSGQMNSLIGLAGKLAATLGTAFGVKQIIESAASLKALNSQFEQTFGQMQSQAETAINGIARSSGILESRLKGVGTSIYAFAKTAGMDSSDALGLMNDALQVTADSAAYYDRSLEDTAESLKSFLKGNFENDAALGLSCTETTRNAAANRLYGKSFQELSESQKQFTLLQMVKDANALSGAMGQAAREADGWENVTGNLKEAWKQLTAAVGEPMLALAVPVVKNITDALMKLTEIARSAAKALESVFGINIGSSDSTAEIADSSEQAAQNYGDMASSAEAAAKANETTLAGFDKVNKLSEDKGSGTAGSGAGEKSAAGSALAFAPTVDVSEVDSRFEELFEKIKKTAGELFDPLKKAWESKGRDVVDSLGRGFGELKGLAAEVAGSFYEVWTNGTGQQALEHILGIFTNINDFSANIAGNLKNAWSENGLGTDMIQHTADLLNIVLGYTEKISGSWADWAADVDFKPILTSLDDLAKALSPFTEDIGQGLLWLHENVLQPLAGWTIEDAIPAALDLIGSSISALSDVWEKAAPVLEERLWDGFLEPIASWAADASVDLVKSLAKGIEKIGKSIDEEDINALIDLAGGVAALVAACKGKDLVKGFTTSLSGLSGKISGAWATATAPIGSAAAETGAAAGATLGTSIFAALSAAIAGWTIGSMIYDKWSEEIDSVLHPIFDGVVKIWEKLKSGFNAYVEGFSDNMLEMTTFFSNLGASISGMFGEAAETISNGMMKVSEFFGIVKGGFDEAAEAISDGLLKVVGFFSEAWTSITEIFGQCGQWFSQRWNDIVNAFINTGSWFKTQFQKAYTNIKTAFSGIKSWFSERWSDVKSVFSSVGTWFGERFTSAWGSIKSAFATVGTFFEGLWTSIKKPFATVATWFHDTFSKAWQKVKDVFSTGGEIFDGITAGISSVFTDTVNAIIDGINVVIATPFNEINSILQTLRNTEIAGWNPFENLPSLEVPSIPRLATGTVVPANYGEFLAVLGDNKREPEIVSPESAIISAVQKALGGGVGGDINIELSILMDGHKMHKQIVKINKEEIRKTGKNPLAAN